MQYLHNDLGNLSGGEVVEVRLDHSANVRLMDASNFSQYRRGDRHRYYGGHMTKSPCRIAVPGPGHWHVAIDLGGCSGHLRAGVRLIG